MSQEMKVALKPASEVIKGNELFQYTLPESIRGASLINMRHTVSYIPSSQSSFVCGDTIQIPIATNEMVYGLNSNLTFKLVGTQTNATPAAVAHGTQLYYGSALNIIEEIKITAANGTELEYIRRNDILAHLRGRWTASKSYLETAGSNMGWGRMTDSVAAGDDKFSIPLCHLSGFFAQERYLPFAALGRITVSFKLSADAKTPFHGTAVTANALVVSDVSLDLDQYQASDAVYSAIMAQAKAGTLTMAFHTFDYNRRTVSANTLTSIEYSKAYSRLLSAYHRVQTTTNATPSYTVNNLISSNYNITSFQHRLGSVFTPSKAVRDKATAYNEALRSWNVFGNTLAHPGVTYAEFITTDGMIGAELERDISVADGFSGSSTKNANLVLEIETSADTTVSSWLHYIRTVKIMPNNVVIYE